MQKIPDFPFAHNDVVSKTVKEVGYLSAASLAADKGVIDINHEAEDLTAKYKDIITALVGLSDEIAKGAKVGSFPSCCISLADQKLNRTGTLFCGSHATVHQP